MSASGASHSVQIAQPLISVRLPGFSQAKSETGWELAHLARAY
jgi:hypothetical protein